MSRREAGDGGRSPVRFSRSFLTWALLSGGACVLWTIAVVVWLSPSKVASAQASSRVESVLTTMATLSGAAIVLALTAVLVGLQLSSRFGSRASRTVTTRPVAVLMGVAGLLGVALPLLAVAAPWQWLRTAGIASFAWTILVIGVAGSRVLAHLNPRWLAAHQVEHLYRFVTQDIEARRAQLQEALSVLLEIVDGTPEGDVDGNSARRALAYVGLIGYRLTGRNDELAELIETLGAHARSASRRGESPQVVAEMLSLIGVVSDDSDVDISVLNQQLDMAQDAIAQRREPVVRALLDEAVAFATDRLKTLLEPATIAWLADQNPTKNTVGLRIVIASQEESPSLSRPEVGAALLHADRRTVFAWVEDTTPPARGDADTLAVLLPPAKDLGPVARIKAEVVEINVERDTGVRPEVTEEHIVIADLSDYLAGVTTPEISEGNTPEDDEQSDAEWQATLSARNRQSHAYDLLEAIVEVLTGACAAPNPDDHGWPGGWRGSSAFATDLTRLAAPVLALYESGRYPPSDRTEAAIEEIVSRLVRTEQLEPWSHQPDDPIGWRVYDSSLRPNPVEIANTTMKELSIQAWYAGFDRRALLTVRRLIAVFTAVVGRGDAGRTRDLAEDLELAITRTAWSSDNTIAKRWRSRQFVLALAQELSTLGRVVSQLEDDATWEIVFSVLVTIGWSPFRSEAEGAAEVYLHFLAGFNAPADVPYFGRPRDVVSWGWHPSSPAAQLPDHVRHQLLEELHHSGTMEQPSLAILSILALWRDAIIAGTTDRMEALRTALKEQILDHGRREFEHNELWDPAEGGKDQAPRFNQPLVHWRVYDIALAASTWPAEPKSDSTVAKPKLPPVLTPDSDILELIRQHGARSLLDERDYWGVEYEEDKLVLVEETDRSRRFLRDCECRSRSRINWGYGGSGPYDLASLLVADALGPLAYCPSCFGTIGAAGGLIECPVCEHGIRPDLWKMQRACTWLTSKLSQSPMQASVTDDAPVGAQWHIRRTDLLDFLVRKLAELSVDDDMEDRSGTADGEQSHSQSP